MASHLINQRLRSPYEEGWDQFHLRDTAEIKEDARTLNELCRVRHTLERNGYAVVEQLLWPEECDELKDAAYELSHKLLEDGNEKMVFNTKDEVQLKEDYFLQSNDKIRAFIESDALDEAGNIKVDPKFSLNKIGHALHLRHPLFRCYTYCDRVKSQCKMLGFVKPTVVQSMIVFKNPNVSSEVQPHQDGSYLFADPKPAIGFWIALEDATVENGCLWIAAGSHKSGIHRRLTRNHDPNLPEKLTYDKPNPSYLASSFKPVPVKKGSCIILHGHVVHKSGINKTDQARPAYTFHVIETINNSYSPDNWLQEGPEAPFQNMYEVQQIVFEDEEKGLDEAAACPAGEIPSTSSIEESFHDDEGMDEAAACPPGELPTTSRVKV